MEKAIADFDEAIKINPDFSWAFESRSKAYKAKGNLRRSLSDAQRALSLQPNNREYQLLADELKRLIESDKK